VPSSLPSVSSVLLGIFYMETHLESPLRPMETVAKDSADLAVA
jgi:hypothetical protein